MLPIYLAIQTMYNRQGKVREKVRATEKAIASQYPVPLLKKLKCDSVKLTRFKVLSLIPHT